jgi:CPA2 family monovalent cation:H+ antiporter-2
MPATPPRSIAPGRQPQCRETLESSLQLSEAVLVDVGVPMGFVIASIHEKRDEYRAMIKDQGGLDEKPVLKSGGLRGRQI